VEKVYDMDELLSAQNLKEAFKHFSNKKDGHGIDGIMLSDSMILQKNRKVGRGM
jgi:hypothetical protein